MGTDDYHQISRDLIGLVEKGEKRAIVSYLLIMETIYVIRRWTVQHSESSDNTYRMEEARAASDRFYNYVMNLMKMGRLILVRSNKIHDHEIFQKQISMPGTVRNKRYKVLGHADIEHAYLADYGGAREFHTTDLSFRDLDGDPDFAVKFVIH